MARKQQEEIPEEEPLQLPENTEEAYNQIATYAPERDVVLPAEDNSPRTLEEKMADVGDLSDMQAILLRLFPPQKDPSASNVMISRVHPDVFLPWIDIMATNEFMASDPQKPIDVAAIRMKWYALASIGLDGKGRIDALELGGAARDNKLLEKQMGSL